MSFVGQVLYLWLFLDIFFTILPKATCYDDVTYTYAINRHLINVLPDEIEYIKKGFSKVVDVLNATLFSDISYKIRLMYHVNTTLNMNKELRVPLK